VTAPAASARPRRGLTGAQRAAALKPLDSAWTVLLVDPPGVRVLAWMVGRPWITPLRLTVAAQLVGVVATAAFALDLLALGAVLFELRFFVDCLDGKLARLRGETSRLGAALDANSDKVVVLASYAALGGAAGEPWAAAAVAATYPLHFVLRDQRDALYAEAGLAKPVVAMSLGGLAGWLRRRRIFPTLTTIEVEHVALFVVPLLAAAGVDVVLPALAGSAAYFGLQGLRFGIATLRAARVLDGAGARPEGRDA